MSSEWLKEAQEIRDGLVKLLGRTDQWLDRYKYLGMSDSDAALDCLSRDEWRTTVDVKDALRAGGKGLHYNAVREVLKSLPGVEYRNVPTGKSGGTYGFRIRSD